MSKATVIVGMVLILIAAPIVGAVGATLSPATTDASTDGTTDELSTGIDNVSIWERSVLPFRADRGAASTIIDLHPFSVDGPNGTDVPANRNKIGLFNEGDDVPLQLQSVDGADTTTYANESVRVIVAEPTSATLGFAESMMMFNVSNMSAINGNVTFTTVSETSITKEGELADNVSYRPDSSGQFVTMVTTIDSGDGLTVDSGDLVDNGKATLVGLDVFHVQDDTSDVSASAGNLGANVTFDATTSIDANTVGHGVFLYDAEVFNSSVSELNGVFRLEDGVFDDTTTTLNSTITNVSGSDGIVLSASATGVVTDNPNATIDVETLEEWNEGRYRYVHVATDGNGNQLQTSTGTVTLEADSGGGGGGFPTPPEDGDEDDDKDDEFVPVITFSPETATVSEPVTISGAESTDPKWEIVSYEWSIGGQEYSGETVTTTFKEPGEYDIELTVTNEIGESATTMETLTVEEVAADGQDPDDEGTGDGDGDGSGDDGGSPIPGFGAAIAIVALLSVALLRGRRQT